MPNRCTPAREISRADAWKVAVEMLDRVEIPHAATRAQDYPHAFSGGMRQRVMIAMALSCSPKLLIADEPTTALDITSTGRRSSNCCTTLQSEEDMAMIFVTHDLGVIADVAADVVVMYAGQIAEQATALDLFGRPRHPYTAALLDSIPQLTPRGEPLHTMQAWCRVRTSSRPAAAHAPRCSRVQDACTVAPVSLREPALMDRAPTGQAAVVGSRISLARCVRQDELVLSGVADLGTAASPNTQSATEPVAPAGSPVLDVTDLVKDFPIRGGVLRRTTGTIRAVDQVSLSVDPGTTLGLVGETGSGKSTLARLILRLIDPTSGTVVVDGKDITSLRGPALAGAHRGRMPLSCSRIPTRRSIPARASLTSSGNRLPSTPR